MSKMKQTSITFALVFALAFSLGIIIPFSSAKAERVQYWAKGVSVDAGWYNTFQFTNGCWAAVSSNMIAWWQDRIQEKYICYGKIWDRGSQSGNLIAALTSIRVVTIYKALDWYLRETHPSIAYTRTNLYQNCLFNGDYDNPIIFTRGYIDSNEAIFTDVLLRYFTTGNYVAQLRDMNHTWTLWAIEVDTETNTIT